MATSLERLSSGLRINRAADDAAGMAVSETMTLQIRGLGQAVRNANDGISLAQTAEGAAGEMHNILQRMNELAVQATNGTYTDTDRAQLNLEFTELKAELDDISGTAKFNGRTLLDGSNSFNLQVGDTAADVVTIAAQDLSSVTTTVSQDLTTSSNASAAIAQIATAVGNVNTTRATFGAVQNRLESKVRNLENVVENISAARSRIKDADFAAETANLTRTQILQQAGIAMLAQANALPQNALSLLR
jgi:flagellin